MAELDSAELGGNQDGLLAAQDPLFDEVRVWLDLNHDGFSDAEELLALEELGIIAVDSGFVETRRRDAHGNEFRYRSRAWVRTEDGGLRPLQTWDVFLVVEGEASPMAASRP